jgi:hypothetical protein
LTREEFETSDTPDGHEFCKTENNEFRRRMIARVVTYFRVHGKSSAFRIQYFTFLTPQLEREEISAQKRAVFLPLCHLFGSYKINI